MLLLNQRLLCVLFWWLVTHFFPKKRAQRAVCWRLVHSHFFCFLSFKGAMWSERALEHTRSARKPNDFSSIFTLPNPTPLCLRSFNHVDDGQEMCYAVTLSSKSCDLDPLPGYVIKNTLNIKKCATDIYQQDNQNVFIGEGRLLGTGHSLHFEYTHLDVTAL